MSRDVSLHSCRRDPRPAPHGASHLVRAMSAWSEETHSILRPSVCWDARRVYGHTTTAMHGVSTPPPLAPPPRASTAGARWGLLRGQGARRAERREECEGMHVR